MERCSGRILELPDTRWKPVIYYETQCDKPVSRLGLCKSCLKHYENSSRKWYGRITDAPKQGYPMAGFRKAKWIGEPLSVMDPPVPVTEPVVTEPVVTEPTVPVPEPTVTEPAVTEPAVTEPAVAEPTVPVPDRSVTGPVPETTVPELPVTEPVHAPVQEDPTIFYTYIAVGAAAAAIYAYIVYRCIDSPPLFPKWSWYQHIFPLA